MAKKKVFVSYDYDNDKTLKDFIIGQARLADSPFDTEGGSSREDLARQGPHSNLARRGLRRDTRLEDPECTRGAQGGQDRQRTQEGQVPDHRLQGRLRDMGSSECRPSLQMGLGELEETPQVTA